MYTHWQAAWRSAGALGVLLLALTCVPLLLAFQAGEGLPSLVVLMTVLAAGVFTSIVAVAFRCGLYLSGIKGIDLSVVAATPAIYLLLLLLFTVLPIETHAVALDMPSSPGQSRHALLVLDMAPIGVIAIALLVVPMVVAYIVARIARARASVS